MDCRENCKITLPRQHICQYHQNQICIVITLWLSPTKHWTITSIMHGSDYLLPLHTEFIGPLIRDVVECIIIFTKCFGQVMITKFVTWVLLPILRSSRKTQTYLTIKIHKGDSFFSNWLDKLLNNSLLNTYWNNTKKSED